MRWLELAAGYDCNLSCAGCFSRSADPSLQMSSENALGWLRRGRAEGARHFWFGGGEPTIRRDFLPILRAARRLGYERIKVQTNGLMFAYPEFVSRAVDAGMTETNLLLRSLNSPLHDEQCGRQGAHALLSQAIDNLRGKVRLEGDVLVTAPTVDELPELVAHYARRGLVRFSVWLFSASTEPGAPELARLVPKLKELGPRLMEARTAAHAAGAQLVSLHTPHCAVSPDAWDIQFDPQRMGLYVVNPDGYGFFLHDSAMEQGLWVDACRTCAVKGACRGLRPDYVAIHGEQEARPITDEEAARHDASGSVLD